MLSRPPQRLSSICNDHTIWPQMYLLGPRGCQFPEQKAWWKIVLQITTNILCQRNHVKINTKLFNVKNWEYIVFTCGTALNFAIASGYDINANPVPLRTTSSILLMFRLCAKLPRIPNIVMPAIRLVTVSRLVTIIASLRNIIVHYV